MSHIKLVSLEAWAKTSILLRLMSYQRNQSTGFSLTFFVWFSHFQMLFEVHICFSLLYKDERETRTSALHIEKCALKQHLQEAVVMAL